METVVLKTHLKEGLEITDRIAAKSPTLPILSNVLLSAKKEGVRLSATDLQIGITYQFLGTTTKEGEVVFLGHPLSSLLAVSLGDRISLKLEGSQLAVAAGDHRVLLKTLDEEEFPIIPSQEGSEPSVEVENNLFCGGLSQVVGMVGQSQVRPEISGVLFVFEKKAARVAATDSFRLAERRFTFEKEGNAEGSFILPAKTAREIIAVLGERPGKTKIYFSPTQAVFVYDAAESPSRLRIQIVSRLIEGEYPHYEDIIPSTHKTQVSLAKNEFLNHLKAAGIFAGKTQEVRFRVDPQKKETTFLSESGETGSHQSTLKGDISGEPVEVAFNWRFLSEGLAQIHGERVDFGLNGEDGPALLRPAEQAGYLYVVMPIKA